MTICNFCDETDYLFHNCKYCYKTHCSKHLLPENHDCEELNKHSFKKKEEWQKNVSRALSSNEEDFREFDNTNQKIEFQKKSRKEKFQKKKIYKYKKENYKYNSKKNQRNWFKYLIIILIILFIICGYIYKDTILSSIFDVYNRTNFSFYIPIGIKNTDLDFSQKKQIYDYEQKQNKNIDIPILKPNIDISSLEKEIHNLVNQERQKYVLNSLLLDTKLSNIARSHSQDMATNDYFDHINLKGQSPTDRANIKKYNCHKNFGSYYTIGIAENIFQNNLYNSVTYVALIPIYDWNTQSEIAKSTVDGWMDSLLHKENILALNYDREGIGVMISSDDKVYITQNFC